MSKLIINRIFKPSVCKNFLRHTNIRLFSSATHTSTKVNQPFSSKPAFPFLLIDYILNNPNSSSDGRVTTNVYGNEKEVLIKDKDLKEEVCDAMTVGFSRDGLRVELCGNHGDVCSPTIFYKPTDPELEDLTVDLPPLPMGSQIQSLVMSSLPKRDKNWVVVVKLLGSQLKKKFYVPTPGGNILCYLDPHSEDDDLIDFVELEFDDLPKSVFQELADVSTCSRTDHLVESPTGQLFLVKWYGEDLEDIDNTTLYNVTRKFMVFKEGEKPSCVYTKKMIYTEDIGDLCIFVGHSEAFCVPASSSPGLKPNCIYFVGYNFGVYDLTTKTCTMFLTKDDNPLRKLEFPYWPPPASFPVLAPN
ncbi:unnamed protein product [Arabidopsis thaliana]|uniref:KIB1-4 beta-propeller domain-containing protein n=1 Tax=Arabidopsis thaliana TaxID=3702 RepID=A0A654FSS1_ARATH|nr:unnamed protein product [Arabidopsis thaliana]